MEKDIYGYTEVDVIKQSNKLADQLNKHYNTTSWKPRVWYNLYWCWSVQSGSIGISEYKDVAKVRYYTAYFSSHGTIGGADSIWFDNDACSAKEPYQAVDNALALAQKIVDKYQKAINENLKLLGKQKCPNPY